MSEAHIPALAYFFHPSLIIPPHGARRTHAKRDQLPSLFSAFFPTCFERVSPRLAPGGGLISDLQVPVPPPALIATDPHSRHDSSDPTVTLLANAVISEAAATDCPTPRTFTAVLALLFDSGDNKWAEKEGRRRGAPHFLLPD